jgi:glycosyltransferase involved in cell wall biosynthesis
LGESVIFAGSVPHEHIPAYATICDIFVNPLIRMYRDIFHGVPIKLLEYMAAGKPIISTDMPSVRDVLGEAALLVPEGDQEAWKNALLSLGSDRDLRERIGGAGPVRLESQGYTWRENARAVFEFCQGILSRNENGN